MVKFLNSLLKDEEGATAIEYGLIAALVGVALVAGLGSLSGGLNSLFGDIGTALTTAGGNL
ncbi:pilus assembly protein Flp/PilA [Constrictibacter sp. MBR-5]|jgi:pilus assembly protein Flp/PilA|uniref:Flp family type IVb pilin n=1 Tax=Constrictibacter sp. MBR-5 TaxID=3156467 RepID=UPI003390A85F